MLRGPTKDFKVNPLVLVRLLLDDTDTHASCDLYQLLTTKSKIHLAEVT